MDTEYRIIEVPLERPLDELDEAAIQSLNQKVPKEELYLEDAGGSLLIYLNTLDTKLFESVISDLAEDSPLRKGLEGIRSIKSYGVKGGKMVFVGYDRERKVASRKDKVAMRGMYYYAQDHGFFKTNNEAPKEIVDSIVCGDSLEVLKGLPDNCVDIVITSPPYNFGLDYDSTTDHMDWDSYFDTLFAIFDECIRVTKYGGRLAINVQPLFSDYIPIHHIISDHFMKRKLIWRGEVLWEKHNYSCKYTAWGSWKSPSNPYMKYSWEFLEIFCKGELKKKGDSDNIDITGDEFKKWVYGKWDIAPERNMSKYGHPAMFPEGLVERTLKLFSYQGDLVLDPFNGAGTTTAVAKRLGRKYLGIDVSEKYCEIAKERL